MKNFYDNIKTFPQIGFCVFLPHFIEETQKSSHHIYQKFGCYHLFSSRV